MNLSSKTKFLVFPGLTMDDEIFILSNVPKLLWETSQTLNTKINISLRRQENKLIMKKTIALSAL